MKKVLSLVLALAMVLGMSTVAMAAIVDIERLADDEASKANRLQILFTEDDGDTWDDDLIVDDDLVYSEKSVDSEYEITNFNDWMAADVKTEAALFIVNSITADGNTYSTGTDATNGSYDSKGYVRINKAMKSKWDLGINISSSTTWKEVKLDDDGTLRFIVKEYLAGTSKKKTKDTVTAKVDSKNVGSSKGTITTTLNNKALTPDEDDEEISLDGPEKVINPDASVSKFTVYLNDEDGDDVAVNTRLFDGKKIYLNLVQDETDLSIALTDKWGFDMYYRLIQQGLTVDASTINFDIGGTWVYAVDNSADYDAVADSVKVIYVGRGDADLPIYEEYFFSTKELTLDTEAPAEPPVEGEGGEDDATVGNTENPAGGPAGEVPNVNYNPGTGR